MPNAKGNHLLLKQGMEIIPTGMAPPRGDCAGWVRAPQIWLPHYAFILSSGYVTCLTEATTEPCQKLRGLSPCGVSQRRHSWRYATCWRNERQAATSVTCNWLAEIERRRLAPAATTRTAPRTTNAGDALLRPVTRRSTCRALPKYCSDALVVRERSLS